MKDQSPEKKGYIFDLEIPDEEVRTAGGHSVEKLNPRHIKKITKYRSDNTTEKARDAKRFMKLYRLFVNKRKNQS
jgi:hypothetical protein